MHWEALHLSKVACVHRTGLRLGQDGKRCIDIDECAEGTAQCDQECVNQDPRETGRQYVCKCRSGYSIDIDNQHKCITKVQAPESFPHDILDKLLPYNDVSTASES